MTRPHLSLALTLVAGALLALPAIPARATSKSVIAYSTSLSPSSVSIVAGDSVTWTNQSENVHNLIATSSNWPAGDRYLFPGGSTTIEFYYEGAFSYTCEYHPDTMRGTVTVADEEPDPDPTESPSPDPTESPSPDPTQSSSPTPTATESASPSPEPTDDVSPSPTASPTPTVLPTFGDDPPPEGAPDAPQLASGSNTPPPDSPFKPPLTILGALVVILLFAGNPLLKPRAEPARVPVARPRPSGPRPRP
jgi:plastocyanin